MSDTNPCEKPLRVAVFRGTKYGYATILHAYNDDEDWSLDDYVRISEWQSIQFKPLSPEAVAGTELIALRKMREKVVGEFSEKLSVIDGRIANLRALGGPSESDAGEVP